MFDDSDQSRLKDLARRIGKAEEAVDPSRGKVQSQQTRENRGGVGAVIVASDLIASVVGMGFLGWLIDGRLDTAPWFMLVMVFVGFAVGFWIVLRAFNRSTDETQSTENGKKE